MELRSQIAGMPTREDLMAQMREKWMQDAREMSAGDVEKLAALQAQISELHLRFSTL